MEERLYPLGYIFTTTSGCFCKRLGGQPPSPSFPFNQEPPAVFQIYTRQFPGLIIFSWCDEPSEKKTPWKTVLCVCWEIPDHLLYMKTQLCVQCSDDLLWFQLESKKDAFSAELQHYCHTQPVVVIRGIAAALKLGKYSSSHSFIVWCGQPCWKRALDIFVFRISRVPDQNGVSQAWYIVEIYHSGRKPSIFSS